MTYKYKLEDIEVVSTHGFPDNTNLVDLVKGNRSKIVKVYEIYILDRTFFTRKMVRQYVPQIRVESIQEVIDWIVVETGESEQDIIDWLDYE